MWENISLFHISISLSLQILWVSTRNTSKLNYYFKLWLTCYSIEPKVNKELSLNLLECMLELFVKVQMFSFVRDIKEKHKVKNKKLKARSLRTEIKKSFSSKDFNHWISSSIQYSLWPRTLNIGQKTAIFIATHLKLHYLQLKVDGYDQKETYVSIF